MTSISPVRNYFDRANNKLRHLIRTANYISHPQPQLVCQTMDYDDVRIARRFLRDPHQWIDPSVEGQFVEKFAQWNGSKHAYAFLSGRAALSACVFALGLMPDDEVIVPGFTCIVVPNAFHFSKVKVVYADIELETYGLDIGSFEKNITGKTKAVLIHHLFGLVCRDYEAIIKLARKHHLYVIEDCAHSTGAVYKGKKVGNFGDVAFYSSELSKIYSTVQGGVVTTNDDFLAKVLSRFYEHSPYPDDSRIEKQLYNVIVNYYRFKHPVRNHFGPRYEAKYKNMLYDSTTQEEIQGVKPKDYGCKMPAAISAIGLNQLRKLDYYNHKRRTGAKRWAHWCDVKGYKNPAVIPGSIPVYLRYPVLVEEKNKQNLSRIITETGVTPGRWFLTNLHPAPFKVEGCPNADRAVKQCINFPTLI